MTNFILGNPVFRAEDASGNPLSGGLLYVYAAGTSNAKAIYQDASGTTAHPQPIVLNARGEALLYGKGNYKFILRDATGVQIGPTIDNYKVSNFTVWGERFLQSTSAAMARAYLGLGTAAFENVAADPDNPQPLDVVQINDQGYYPNGDGRNITNIQPQHVTRLIDAVTPMGYHNGCRLLYVDRESITITKGHWKSDNNEEAIILPASITKKTSGGEDGNAWEAGDGKCGLYGTALVKNAWYHVFLIRGSETFAGDTTEWVDVIFSRDMNPESLPDTYTVKRYIGSFHTIGVTTGEGTSAVTTVDIKPFLQWKDMVLWKKPVNNYNKTIVNRNNPSTLTLSVPSGRRVKAIVNVALHRSNVAVVHLYSAEQENQLPGYDLDHTDVSILGDFMTQSSDEYDLSGYLGILTDTSSRIRAISDRDGAELSISTIGWIYDRAEEGDGA